MARAHGDGLGIAAGAAPMARVLALLGAGGLIAGLLFGLALVFALAAFAPESAPLFAVALVALAAFGVLLRLTLGPLVGLLVLFGLTTSYSPGLQPEEVVFAGYFLGYMGLWYALRLGVYRERLVYDVGDAAVAFLLLYTTAALGLSVLHRAPLYEAANEWMNYAMLAFYFPLREVCQRYRRGQALLLVLLICFGLLALTRNLVLLQAAISNAEHAYQIARGRVAKNEMLMFVPAIGALALALAARTWRGRSALLAAAAALIAGVILSQSRAYFVGLGIALALLVVLSEGRQRGRLLVLLVVGGASLVAFALVFYGDFVTLFAYALLDRLLSIGTATEKDLSYLSRVVESRAAWAAIRESPILGQGPGVSYSYYDVITRTTYTKSYVHNAYLATWYKYGAIGLGAILLAWGNAIACAFRAYRRREAGAHDRAFALFALTALLSLLLPHLVNAAFITADTVLVFTLLLAVASGVDHRTRPASILTRDR